MPAETVIRLMMMEEGAGQEDRLRTRNLGWSSLCQVILMCCASVSLTGSLPRAGIPRWYSGCYVNEEDACFEVGSVTAV